MYSLQILLNDFANINDPPYALRIFLSATVALLAGAARQDGGGQGVAAAVGGLRGYGGGRAVDHQKPSHRHADFPHTAGDAPLGLYWK